MSTWGVMSGMKFSLNTDSMPMQIVINIGTHPESKKGSASTKITLGCNALFAEFNWDLLKVNYPFLNNLFYFLTQNPYFLKI